MSLLHDARDNQRQIVGNRRHDGLRIGRNVGVVLLCGRAVAGLGYPLGIRHQHESRCQGSSRRLQRQFHIEASSSKVYKVIDEVVGRVMKLFTDYRRLSITVLKINAWSQL
jgi:hypothetical protein